MEPIPTPCHRHNLRTALTRDGWERISRQVRETAGGRCEICGSTNQVQCDEQWSYDDHHRTQHLVGLRCVCITCHNVIHIGRTNKIARQFPDRYPTLMDDVRAHFMRVNDVDRDVYRQHLIEVVQAHGWRSGFNDWRVAYGDYAKIVSAVEAQRAERALKKTARESS